MIPPNPSGILTAILPCNDLDASERFYNQLGFTRPDNQRPALGEPDTYRMLSNGNGGYLHLTDAVEGWLVPGKNPFGLYLYLEDVDAMARKFHKSPKDESNDTFKVSREADALANTQDLDACRKTTLPYGNSIRTLQIDMVAFDNADESIRAYEIKRGNGHFDAGKIRSITRDLKYIQVLLKSYGEVADLKATTVESKIIFYYGVRSIPRPWSLTKGELDEHFGFPVVEKIEQANDYFRSKLHALLEAA